MESTISLSATIQLTNIASLLVAQRNRLDPAGAPERLFRIAAADFLLVAAWKARPLRMKSYSVLWEVGLQVKMKSSPASVIILATGWQANRSSPRNTGRNGASRAPCLANQRLTALSR